MAMNSIFSAENRNDSGDFGTYIGDTAGNLVAQSDISAYQKEGTFTYNITGSLFSIFDGSVATYYQIYYARNGVTEEIGVSFDMGKLRNITHFLAFVTGYVNNGADGQIIYVETSKDNVTWTARENSGALNMNKTYNFSTAGYRARYVRMYGLHAGSWIAYKINQISIKTIE